MVLWRLWAGAASMGMAHAALATSVVPQPIISSPDRRIEVLVQVRDRVTYSVRVDGKSVLQDSQLGVLRDDADFTRGLNVTSNYEKRLARLEKVEDHYELPTIKRRHNHYVANRGVVEVHTASGARMDIEFQVSNDGFAFRYVFPHSNFYRMPAHSCSRWRRRVRAGTRRILRTRKFTSATSPWAHCRRRAGRTYFRRCSARASTGCW